ncbi:MAG: FliA/WhiG family RNA polymerase sigma factor [Clostridiales bacterium]|nr:FliA/WhiG family RNA polymerase sigma factor [Clostridiales bacterium]
MPENMGYSNKESQIVKYIPLVKKIVDTSFFNYNGEFDKDDLFSIGIIGLMDALDKYDASKNASFETYARWRVKGAIYDELRKHGKVSRAKMDKVNKLYGAIEDLQQRMMHEPTDLELMDYLDITSVELNEIYDSIHYLSSYSLEKTIFYKVDQEYSLKDILEDKDAKTPDLLMENEEKKKILGYAIKNLKEREQILLNLIYFEELPVKDIAEILEISSSRVSQLHGKMLVKLKNNIKEYMEIE